MGGVFGVFSNPLDFSKNATLSTHEDLVFLRSGESQNGANMTPKMEPKSSSGAGGLRESLRERFWRVLEGPRGSPEAPQERPRSAQERPRAPKMRRVKMSPRRGQSELREVPGGFRERFGEDFRSIFKQRDATETLPAQTAGEGA